MPYNFLSSVKSSPAALLKFSARFFQESNETRSAAARRSERRAGLQLVNFRTKRPGMQQKAIETALQHARAGSMSDISARVV